MIDSTFGVLYAETGAHGKPLAVMALRTRSVSAISQMRFGPAYRHGPDHSGSASWSSAAVPLQGVGWSDRSRRDSAKNILLLGGFGEAGQVFPSGWRNGARTRGLPAPECGHRCTIRRRHTAILCSSRNRPGPICSEAFDIDARNRRTPLWAGFSPGQAAGAHRQRRIDGDQQPGLKRAPARHMGCQPAICKHSYPAFRLARRNGSIRMEKAIIEIGDHEKDDRNASVCSWLRACPKPLHAPEGPMFAIQAPKFIALSLHDNEIFWLDMSCPLSQDGAACEIASRAGCR